MAKSESPVGRSRRRNTRLERPGLRPTAQPGERPSVHKKIEVVGTSSESFAKAAANAVARAAESVRGLEWFEVTELRGRVRGDAIDEYQATLKIGFKLE